MIAQLCAALLALATPVAVDESAPQVIKDFSFVQVTDTHISPHLASQPKPGSVRGGDVIAWICRETGKPQVIPGFDAPTSRPSFAINTGDLTEYGVIDDTWEVFQRAFAPLPLPQYVLPGNHDNTWVAMYHIMRELYGGENYSFDKFGCHFACISSASPQEPVPTIDAKTRTWLKQDLEQLPPGKPAFVCLHHPLYSDEFANPAEYDTLIDMLRDHNIVLMLYGHGHSVSHRTMDGIDGVMGGTTFGKNAGYAVFDVRDETLRVAYRYHHKAKKEGEATPTWRKVLEKPIRWHVPERAFRIVKPEPDTTIQGDSLEVVLGGAGDNDVTQLTNVTFKIDGTNAVAERDQDQERATWRIVCGELMAGCHLLSVRGQSGDGPQDLRTVMFVAESDLSPTARQRTFPAAIKAGPVVAADKLFVACTDGNVIALNRDTGETLWTFSTGGEILGTPAWSGDVLVFGSGDGKVYAVDGSGKETWSFEAGLPVYGPPLIDGNTVFVGDNGGRMHALGLTDGNRRWTFERADFSIESKPAVWGKLIVFGAWDGYLYAVRRTDGSLAWKSLGPKSSEGKAAQYYAPADCGPIVATGKLFVCDRGYQLGLYTREGKLQQKWADKIAGICTASDKSCFYTRTLDNRVCKWNANGEVVWQTAVPAGRFPIPPTEAGGNVYVCSNRGQLSVLDESDGHVLWTYQVTPGFYVMAPVAVAAGDGPDQQPVCYIAGMDGSLTALRARKPQPKGVATSR